MSYQTRILKDNDIIKILDIEEDHFNDFKAKDISGKGFSKIVSALGNASGGDIYIGIREENDTKVKHWEGFSAIEDCNAFLQVIDSIDSVLNYYDVEFLKHPTLNTYVLRITIFKTPSIVYTTDTHWGQTLLRKYYEMIRKCFGNCRRSQCL